jgi:NAD-dependent deacetylase
MIDIKNWIEKSNKIVIFTGAGISTESGIPDFRSPGGIWTKMQPIMFQDFLSSKDSQIESWRRKFVIDEDMKIAQPNIGHKAITKLYAKNKISYILTQNIDNLHHDSGIPADKIIELHGNSTYAKCLDCNKRYELNYIREYLEKEDNNYSIPPKCIECNGIIKSATISFGQPMPVKEMQIAERASIECDLFIAIGSSLKVYPAAGLPILAKKNGAKLIIINRESTELDSISDKVLNKEIGVTLDKLFE